MFDRDVLVGKEMKTWQEKCFFKSHKDVPPVGYYISNSSQFISTYFETLKILKTLQSSHQTVQTSTSFVVCSSLFVDTYVTQSVKSQTSLRAS